MRSTSARVEFVSFASDLPDLQSDWQSTTTTLVDTYEGFSVGHATKYLVTFEMTIKPLPEEPSISGSHPLTDGSGE